MFSNAIVSASFAALAFSVFAAAPASAQIYVQVAPPAPRYEAVPAPRRGHVWTPGHWEWRHNRHVWRNGQWVRGRTGYRYNQPQWVERGNRWEYRRGRWDRDGDGVPNNRDRQPKG